MRAIETPARCSLPRTCEMYEKYSCEKKGPFTQEIYSYSWVASHMLKQESQRWQTQRGESKEACSSLRMLSCDPTIFDLQSQPLFSKRTRRRGRYLRTLLSLPRVTSLVYAASVGKSFRWYCNVKSVEDRDPAPDRALNVGIIFPNVYLLEIPKDENTAGRLHSHRTECILKWMVL